MECRNCGDEMSFIACHDNPNTGYAFNVYFCDSGCGALVKQSVWNDKSDIWIFENNAVVKETPNTLIQGNISVDN